MQEGTLSANFAEYERYDAVGLARLVREREVTPLELLEAALARAAQQNPRLNAIVALFESHARDAVARVANGNDDNGEAPFAGVPFLIKDVLEVIDGVPTTCGSAFLRTYVPRHRAEITRRREAAGLIAFGKTNTPEFGILPTTEPLAFGPTRNPWDLTLSVGGSSGGSAAAVAAGIVPIASASDGGGSIRIPAACCGIVGLKPTRNRTPLGPVATDPWAGLVVAHVVTRSVRDSALALDASAGYDVGAPSVAPTPARSFASEVGAPPGRLRIAYTRSPLIATSYDRDVLDGLDATLRLLESLGHDVYEAKPAIDAEGITWAMLVLIASEATADLAWYASEIGREPGPDDIEPLTRNLQMLGKSLSAFDYALAVRNLHATGRTIGRFMETCDVFLTPTLAKLPVELGTLAPIDEAMQISAELAAGDPRALLREGAFHASRKRIYDFIDATSLANISGNPAISLPLHWSASGIPVGMMFQGRFGDEATLLRLAAQLEAARPWFDRRPPTLHT